MVPSKEEDVKDVLQSVGIVLELFLPLLIENNHKRQKYQPNLRMNNTKPSNHAKLMTQSPK
jgi:hypothetical protein